jgi:transcriptional regulator of acetoin/glycerol metabolism
VSFCDHELIELSDLPDYVRSARPAAPRDTAPRRPQAPPAQVGATGPSPLVAPKTPEELLGVGVTFKDAKERWVSTFERDYILQTLRRNSGNISHAAREADIDRKYYRKLMKKYDIEAAGVDDADDAE